MDTSSTKFRILQLAYEPITYTELRDQVGVSDPAIQRHLADLQGAKLVAKLVTKDGGKYVLTRKGLKALVSALEQDCIRRFFDGGNWEPTIIEIVNDVLGRKGPMHYMEITDEVLKRKSIEYPHPEKLVLTVLDAGSGGKAPLYVRLPDGVYGLKSREA